MATLPYYQDFNADIGPGAGGSSPGSGLTSNNAINANSAAPGDLTDATGQMSGLNDMLRQFTDTGASGGAQGGSLGERLAGAARAGFADPTLGNIARSAMMALGVASPMGPLSLAEGAAIQGLHLPGYASPILGVAGQLLGLPGPTTLTDLQGWGAYPPDLLNALATATTPDQVAAIQTQLQAYAQAHGGTSGHDFTAGPGGVDVGGLVEQSGGGFVNPGNVMLNALKDAIQQGTGTGGGNAGGGSTGGGIGGGPGGSHASVAGF